MKLSILLLSAMAVALLVADRYLRILPYIQKVQVVNEPFQMPRQISGRACGNRKPPCLNNEKCGNGFCISTEPASLVEKNPLPVLP
jgi:hypothetical protein